MKKKDKTPKVYNLDDAVTVYCLTCGQELRQVKDPDTDGETWPCYRWLTPSGALADYCPGCATSSSFQTMAPAPSPATVAALVQALHQLCASVQQYYTTAPIRTAGHLDAGRHALRMINWDPNFVRYAVPTERGALKGRRLELAQLCPPAESAL